SDAIPEYLSTAVVLLDPALRIDYLNPAAEMLFGVSARQLQGQPLRQLAGGAADLEADVRHALATGSAHTERERRLLARQPVTVDVTLTPLPEGRALLELVQLDHHLRISREHRLIAEQRAIRELV